MILTGIYFNSILSDLQINIEFDTDHRSQITSLVKVLILEILEQILFLEAFLFLLFLGYSNPFVLNRVIVLVVEVDIGLLCPTHIHQIQTHYIVKIEDIFFILGPIQDDI